MTRHTERANNFDLLRLCFAATVVVWHCYALSKAEALRTLALVSSADLGVRGFFVVSGFLVLKSCDQSSSLGSYVGKRARRIYPAYFAVVALAFLLGALFTAVPLGEYLFGGGLSYLAWNLAFLNFMSPTLPGVFTGNPWVEVNGSLWTLKIEVMFYALVPLLLVLCRRLGALRVLLALYVLSVVYSVLLLNAHAADNRLLWLQLQRQLPGQLTYFLVGSALYLHFDWARRNWALLGALAAVSCLISLLSGDPRVDAFFVPLALGIAVIFAAYGLPYLGNAARFGDLSYGLYIVHFPLIQVLVASGFFVSSPWQAFYVSMAGSVLLALLCWRAIEKPFLSRGSHYRLAEARAVPIS
jgi:peptidoglycan/LPS O-acetylase OafA/YrhL